MNNNYVKSNIRIKLIEFLFNTHKLGTDFFIAKIMLEKTFDFPEVTIEEVAYLANTTPASVSKFCKKLGYSGFIELRSDTLKYDNGNLFHPIFYNKEKLSIDQTLDVFLQSSTKLLKNLFSIYDQHQIERIAKRLQHSKKVTVFSGIHGFAASNLFVELMFPFNITVYEIERDSELSVIENALAFSDLVFVISLTGKFANKTFSTYFSKEDLQKIIVLNHSDTIHIECSEVISLSKVDNFFTSSYISSNALESFFILLA
ncbi:MAG: MurR/RpiR family transcriptional regulator, partial [Coprobacillaceae bacterium]